MTAPRNRRQVLGGVAGTAAALLWPRPAITQGTPRVVIVGGGFGGASCARALREIEPRIVVTLVEARRVYTAPPLSNGVLGGLRELSQQQFTYDKITAAGIEVVNAAATAVNAQNRSVSLSTGDKLSYDKLVLAPGIDFRWDAIGGYSEKVSAQLPHAWTSDGMQIALLQNQLQAMEDGGVVAMVVPVNPARCPPGPYERASMIAHYLKTNKPNAKLVILDNKDTFSMQQLFEAAWKTLYPGMIEWVSPSAGGNVASIDAAKKTIETDFDKYKFSVANVIPPQIAGRITVAASVADRTGWCPIDPITFESLLQKNIHVIGDAAIAGALPKSAFAASVAGKLCAAALVRILADQPPVTPKLVSNCYSLVAPNYAISIAGVYQPVDGQYVEVEGAGGVSPLDATLQFRAEEAKFADAWFRTNTAAIFG
ncbi:MAG TPA: NAD(P)/FAD-dependent oxidoreductase [Xanthobacteraceae bacterium]|jgi:NADPH-dependent 2,4-dienoyl-CoA reductase/sulfur reductase-like enzyme|nr:NAD(P)/FAD-dependent oxidoreductase [Xanthobacteraceae bacterium]